jgi:O-acetylhomoserine/O-acetylserine sulfhydrylase-like pyridoxal-dependent enzyme
MPREIVGVIVGSLLGFILRAGSDAFVGGRRQVSSFQLAVTQLSNTVNHLDKTVTRIERVNEVHLKRIDDHEKRLVVLETIGNPQFHHHNCDHDKPA